ncbi:MAG: flagellar basal body rod protein FlgG [Phycisphaerae bacterium]|nr:Flagellar basal-body rod protein FlgG [Phycisphaerales bacterium]MCK6478355.1 flagellar basal-body rod protein FlgG [Phycisphaerales bacterium]
MAIIALQSASTGLTALNTQLDVIANNLANVNTPGFKQSRANFQDLLYLERAQAGTENANGDQRPTGLYVGLGVQVSATQQSFEQGAPLATGRTLDIMIEGNGFFRVQTEPEVGNGYGYARAGNFTLNSEGEIVLANDQGRRLDPNISIPEDATQVSISSNGEVSVIQPGNIEPTVVGQIEIATFINPAGLESIGENLWIETAASGPAQTGEPSTENRGKLLQGYLEASNVDPTKELIELIRTQRAFDMNSQVIRASDEVLRTVSQLRT